MYKHTIKCYLILHNQNFNFGLDWIRFARQMDNKILRTMKILNLLKIFQILYLLEVNINFREKLFLQQCHDEPYLKLLRQFFLFFCFFVCLFSFIRITRNVLGHLFLSVSHHLSLYIKQFLPLPWVILYTCTLPIHNLAFKFHGFIITFNVILYSKLDTAHGHILNLVITSKSFDSKITY